MIKYICYGSIIFMTIVGSFASFFLKKASSYNKVINIFFNVNIYIGGILYILSSIINIYVLKYLEYSIVLPLTSITYIWTMILSYLMLNEIITLKKVIGVLFIVIGSIIISSI